MYYFILKSLFVGCSTEYTKMHCVSNTKNVYVYMNVALQLKNSGFFILPQMIKVDA